MKIAIITETFLPSTDGIVTRLKAAVKWLKEQNHEVLVIAPDLGVYEYEGVRVAGVKAYRFFLYRNKKLAFPSRKVGRLLKEFNPDLVHVVNPAVLGVAGIHYGKRWPLVASYHTNIPHYANYYKLPFLEPVLWWYLRKLHNKADLNLCTSKTVLTELNSQRFHNVHLWDRGVDVDLYQPQKNDPGMRERLTDHEPHKRLLLYVGRLAVEKEIEVIRDVLEASDDIRLAIVGDGPHRQTLEEHFKGTRTVFTGYLHGEELARAYASSDIFVFPSTTETLGLVILEAMASGLPVIAAKSGPTCEQIEEGKNGLLYDPDQKHSFVDTVAQLNDEEKRKKMGEYARETARSLGWEKPSRQLLEFYQEVLRKFT